MKMIIRFSTAMTMALGILALAACSNEPAYWAQHSVGNMAYPGPLPQGDLTTTTP